MSARQCLKRLHLEVHRPELANDSGATEAAFARGHQVGDAARKVYGGDRGVLIPYEGGLTNALRQTTRLLREGANAPIFEATIQHAGVLVRIDVLLPDGASWRIVEVKASTSVKDEHVFDCATQRWVFEGSGLRLSSIALAHVDNSFVYAGNGAYRGLLKEVDQTEATEALLPAVPEWIARAQEAAAGSLPDVPVGAHCGTPYACPFTQHCWPAATDYPIQWLGGSKAKLGNLIALGFEDIRDVPVAELSQKQARIQRITMKGEPELLPGARDFVAGLKYPRYYLDFETIAPAVPLWPGTRPYETLPFQWSCHIEPADGDIGHAQFLNLSGEPPMRSLAESLLRVLGSAGPVLMYTPYEKRVIQGLAERLPDLAAPLAAIMARLVDLKPVTEQNFYHPAMAGSWSLKAVLPAISDNSGYINLAGIQDGMAASEGYLEAIDSAVPAQRKAELEAQLLRYCRFDTEAMVRLVQFLGYAT